MILRHPAASSARRKRGLAPPRPIEPGDILPIRIEPIVKSLATIEVAPRTVYTHFELYLLVGGPASSRPREGWQSMGSTAIGDGRWLEIRARDQPAELRVVQ